MPTTRGLLAALVLLAVPAPARAAWLPGGTPVSPAPSFPAWHQLAGCYADAEGGVFVVWQSATPQMDNTTQFALLASRLNFDGDIPVPWPAAGVPFKSWTAGTSPGTFSVEPRPMVGDGFAGAILPALDHGSYVETLHQLRAWHVQPGATVGGYAAFPEPTGGPVAYDAAFAADGSGGLLFIAEGQTFAPPLDPLPPTPLFVQRMNAAGTLLWPSGSAPGPELVPAGQSNGRGLAALGDGTGGGFVAWTDRRSDAEGDLYVQRLDPNGLVAPGWPAGGLAVCTAGGAQTDPRLLPDGSGGVIVIWSDARDSYPHVYAIAVLGSGSIAPGMPVNGRPLPSGSISEALVSVDSDGAGGCFVVRAATAPSLEVVSWLHRLGPTLQTASGWPAEGIALSTLSAGDGRVGLVHDPLGGAFVSYRNGFGVTAPQGLYAKHFTAGGSLAPGWSADGYPLSGYGQESKLVASGDGAIAVWSDTRGGSYRIYAQRLADDGPVAVELSLAEATARAGGATLRWFATGGLERATVERSEAPGAWAALAEIEPDGTGYLSYEDEGLAPGGRYGYRLTWAEDGATRSGGEVWLDVPAAGALSLDRVQPNPVAGPARIAFTLPRSAAARLDVLDLAGRRVLARELTGLEAGPHTIVLDAAARLAPGVYLVRLTHPDGVRFARMCVMR